MAFIGLTGSFSLATSDPPPVPALAPVPAAPAHLPPIAFEGFAPLVCFKLFLFNCKPQLFNNRII